jgi:hypothetical protein
LQALTETRVNGQLHIPDHLFLLKETLEPTGKNGYKKSVFIDSNSSQNNMQVTGQPLAAALALTVSEKLHRET